VAKKIISVPQHKELGITPSSPESGYKKIYAKSNGAWYSLDSDGNEIALVQGEGTPNFIPRWESETLLSLDSSIYDDGEFVEIRPNGTQVAQINEDGITVNQDKEFSIISGASFQTVEEFDLTTEVAIPYPYIIKVGSRIFVSEYGKAIFEFDEDLNLVDTYTVDNYVYGLQYNPTLNRLYLGGWEYLIGEKYYLDLTTNLIVTATTLSERLTDYIAFNQLDNRIYTVNYVDATLDFYDEDYNYIGGEPLPGGTDVWGITTNQQNGKIYLSSSVGLNGQVLIYESTISGVNPIATVSYPGESFGIYNSFGADYDNDRNRAYVAIKDFIAVIDGDTDSSITTIDISSYGSYIRSIRYFDNQIIVTVNNTTSPANTYLLSINPDTYAITQIKSDTVNNFNLYNSGIYDGSHYYAIINQNSLIKVDDDGTNNLAKIVSSNLTETVTHTLQAKSGTLAHLEDFVTGKTIWVDSTYGNNTTAAKYNFVKPYATLAAAMAAAVSGDTIFVRPGTYTATSLKNGVNIHFENGTFITSGEFSDLGATVTCKITGHLDFSSSSSMFNIGGNNSDIYIEMNKITHNGSGYLLGMNPGSGNTSKLNFNCKSIIAQGFVNGQLNFDQGANVIMNVDSVIYAASAFNQRRIFTQFYDNFVGTADITFNTLTFLDNGTGAQYIAVVFSLGEGGSIKFNGNSVVSTNATEAGFEFENGLFSINSGGANSVFECNIKNIKTEARQLFASISGGEISSSKIFNNLNFTQNYASSTYKGAIRISRSYDKYKFKNCKFSVGSDGDDNNVIVGVGDNSNLPGIFAGQSDYFNIEFIDCQFIKESLGTDISPLILVDGENSNIAFKNCDIVFDGPLFSPAPFAIDADTLLEGNVYFKNTISNLDNSTNITDTALVSGFIGNDTNLTIL
jgi:hypothetical protein